MSWKTGWNRRPSCCAKIGLTSWDSLLSAKKCTEQNYYKAFIALCTWALFSRWSNKNTSCFFSSVAQNSPQHAQYNLANRTTGKHSQLNYHHTYNHHPPKKYVITVHLLLPECWDSSQYASVQQVWQLCNISALLCLDQLRSVKGRGQGAFICMYALSHREGISLRHGESCGLHEAQG